MKLFVQIPCLNEEHTLPLVLKDIPKKIDGISSIEILVIDDGSSDKTIDVAKKHGVKHFVIHEQNKGLSKSFSDGLDYALQHGADVIVNTDGDNQYPGKKIADLVQPIVHKEAEIVIGDRQTSQLKHFGLFKRIMQRFGSQVVNMAAGTNVADTVSGFRAYSRSAALQLYTINTFSYCTETIIHAGRKGISMTSVTVGANPPTRKSRLFKNIWQHMFKSGKAILKGYFMHKPYTVFLWPGFLQIVISAILYLRYFVFFIQGDGSGHLQSLIVATALLVSGVLFIGLGILADLIKTNRIIMEDILERTRKQNLKK